AAFSSGPILRSYSWTNLRARSAISAADMAQGLPSTRAASAAAGTRKRVVDIRLLLLEPMTRGRQVPPRTTGDALIVSACRRFGNQFPAAFAGRRGQPSPV